MARGAVLKFSYQVAEALRGWALANWSEFNGWAVMNRVNLFDLPSREFMNLLYFYLVKEMNQDQKDSFNFQLEEIESDFELTKAKKQQQQNEILQAADAVSGVEAEPAFVPYKAFAAPAGWTPPGWKSDEEAYNNALGFMSWQTTAPKGGN